VTDAERGRQLLQLALDTWVGCFSKEADAIREYLGTTHKRETCPKCIRSRKDSEDHGNWEMGL